MIDQFFLWCVWVLEVIGEVTGMGYELANIVIFVILQPGLIIFFLFCGEIKKSKIINLKRFIIKIMKDLDKKLKIIEQETIDEKIRKKALRKKAKKDNLKFI